MGGMRYMVREKWFSIGDDFWVTDEHDHKVFKVNGKVLTVREAMDLEDASGKVVAKIHKKLVAIHDSMRIERDGEVVATVKKALISPLHHRSVIELGGGEWEAIGNIIDKEFEIRSGHQVLATISRKWFRLRDTYGVDVGPGQDDALIIAIAACLDRIHDDVAEKKDKEHRIG